MSTSGGGVGMPFDPGDPMAMGKGTMPMGGSGSGKGDPPNVSGGFGGFGGSQDPWAFATNGLAEEAEAEILPIEPYKWPIRSEPEKISLGDWSATEMEDGEFFVFLSTHTRSLSFNWRDVTCERSAHM